MLNMLPDGIKKTRGHMRPPLLHQTLSTHEDKTHIISYVPNILPDRRQIKSLTEEANEGGKRSSKWKKEKATKYDRTRAFS